MVGRQIDRYGSERTWSHAVEEIDYGGEFGEREYECGKCFRGKP